MIEPDNGRAAHVIDEDGPYPPDEAGASVTAPESPYFPVARGRRRVRKITPPLKRKVCEAIANGASPTRAAKAIGVSRSALYYQRDVDPEFREAWAEALETQADMYEDALRQAAIEQKNIGDIIFGLKNLRSDKWKDRHEVEERRFVEVSVTLESLPSAQREALIAALERQAGREQAQLTEGTQEKEGDRPQ